MLGSVLVTGGAGFFGRHFVRRLLDRKLSDRVCIYSRDEFKQFQMRQAFADDTRLRWFIGDVRDPFRLYRALQGVDIVVHAAALKRIEVGRYNPTEMVLTNVRGAMNVVDCCHDRRVATAVLLSTDKAYQPISPYGLTKALAESMFVAANETGGAGATRFVVTRYGNVAGSTGSVIPLWRATTGPVRVTDPQATRFWMTADEAVDLVLAAITCKTEDILIPTLRAFTLDALAQAMGKAYTVTGLPTWEKKHESLSEYQCSETAPRMSVKELKEALRHVE